MIAVNWFPINTVGFLILAKVILQIGCILGDGGVPSANRAWAWRLLMWGLTWSWVNLGMWSLLSCTCT